jgi:hypothetical protein
MDNETKAIPLKSSDGVTITLIMDIINHATEITKRPLHTQEVLLALRYLAKNEELKQLINLGRISDQAI